MESSPSPNDATSSFQAAWEQHFQGGPRPVLEDYLAPQIPAVAQRTRLAHLLRVELAARIHHEEDPQLDEYLPRLAAYQDWLREHFADLLAEFRSVAPTRFRQDGWQDGFQDGLQDDDDELEPVVEPSRSPGRPRPAVPPAEHPDQIGPYRVTRCLGEGEFGQVFQAYDALLDRQVAIKVPHPKRHGTQELKAFAQEARDLNVLGEHPAIVKLHHVGQDAPPYACYLVTEYVEGGNLRTLMMRGGIGVRRIAELILRIAEGLAFAHHRGIVHRDLKPANILIDDEGKPRIADFGLALRPESFGQGPVVAGSVPYMSPEQARAESHRVDGRSDIFSLGSIFYELLCRRLPFEGETLARTLEMIVRTDPVPPREIDPAVPLELERICLKALSKRIGERYANAVELVEDLQAFLQRTEAATWVETQTVKSDQLTAPAPLVPKGLRAFDAEDSEFYLDLLPGPYDRQGLPDNLRFWKGRIEGNSAAFSVGVAFGPAGAGKSSLIRAGLLPRLASRIVPLDLVVAASGSEAELLASLRRQFPQLAEDDLPATMARLRSEPEHLAGRKLLLVLDQFEQCLHGRQSTKLAALIAALRQCDGLTTQCLLVVRDDFWRAVSRFMSHLEIPMLEGQNCLRIDLFDRAHTRGLLHRFGVAHGRLPEDPAALTPEQHQFIEDAVSLLAVEGRISPLHLAVLLEVVKPHPWQPEVLARFGRSWTGLGTAFLEQTFESSTASPRYVLHREAAISVLDALMPGPADVQGRVLTRSQLQELSGYAHDPVAFQQLLQILAAELRLVTVCDAVSGAAGPGEQSYRLAQDFFVPALRVWLDRIQRATFRGRARSILTRRLEQWQATQDRHSLPNLGEYATILLGTTPAERSPAHAHMLAAASRVHLTRLTIFLVVMLAGVGFMVQFSPIRVLAFTAVVLLSLAFAYYLHRWQRRAQVERLVDKLLAVGPADVLPIVRQLEQLRPFPNQLIHQWLGEALPRKQLHGQIALLPEELEPVLAALVDLSGEHGEREQYTLARDALRPHLATPPLRQRVADFLRRELAHGAELRQRFRAALALVNLDLQAASAPHPPELCLALFQFLANLPPPERLAWFHLLGERAELLKPTLLENLHSDQPAKRNVAFQLLGQFTEDVAVWTALIAAAEAGQLSPLLLAAPGRETALWELIDTARVRGAAEADTLRTSLARSGPEDDAWEPLQRRRAELRLSLLRPQVNGLATLLTGSPDPRGRDLLQRTLCSGDPTLASELLALLPKLQTDFRTWNALLHETAAADAAAADAAAAESAAAESAADAAAAAAAPAASLDDGARRGPTALLRWLLLLHGRLPLKADSEALLQLAREIGRSHPDPGVHAAAQWMLRRHRADRESGASPAPSAAGEPAVADSAVADSAVADSAAPAWLVSSSGHTFSCLGPVDAVVGSPADEHYREFEAVEDEQGRAFPIEEQRHVALARFAIAATPVTVGQYQQMVPDYRPLKELAHASASPRQPAHMISWREAGVYCNRLSRHEGLTPAFDEAALQFDCSVNGYRLPTSAEWEFACRGRTTSSRWFGEIEQRLEDYAWFLDNSRKRGFCDVGRFPPNPFGLFDVLGNVTEWCVDRVSFEGESFRVARGGAYDDPARYLRSALVILVNQESADVHVTGSMGFRLARTLGSS